MRPLSINYNALNLFKFLNPYPENLFQKIFNSLLLNLRGNPWKMIVVVILLAELLTFLMNTLMGLIWWGRVDKDLLIIGIIDALVVSAIVGTFTIGLILYLVDYKERVFSEEKLRHREIEDRLSQIISEKTEALQKMNAELKQRLEELNKAMEEVHGSERFLRTIFDSIRDPFCIIDKDFRIVKANEAYARMKNKPLDSLIGSICYESLYNRTSICDTCVIDKTFRSGEPSLKEKFVPRPEGYGEWVEIYTYPIFFAEGQVSHVVEYVRSITERKKAEEEKRMLIERLERLSRTDGLTGMLNKRALMERLHAEFDRAKRYRTGLVLIICDIDDFKNINDRHGHACGDSYLKLIARVMFNSIRSADTIGRFGGDEFMIIIPGATIEDGLRLAERMRFLIEETVIDTGNGAVSATISAGIASIDDKMTSVEDIIKAADNALYRAKSRGKNRVELSIFL